VSNGYNQKPGIDDFEVFALVARLDTICIIISFSTQNNWKIHQRNVKSAFLNRTLEEEVYIEQPAEYVIKGKEDKVYKLNKALYGLKQAPRAWYKKIDAYFVQNGFQICLFKHTLYIKFFDPGDILIVCLYVDDLIFTSNNSKMIIKFKEAIIRCFEMTDLGLMSYFLGIEVDQQNDRIFISQKKYAADILKKFKMENLKPISTLVEEKLKLTRDSDKRRVDATYYKSLIESPRYLTATRPDIAFGVGLLSRFTEEPRVCHLQGAKRILKYIKGTD